MAKYKWSFQVPPPDDLKGWKEADLRLTGRFAEYLQFEDRPWSPRAVKRYFDDDNLEYFLKKHKERGVMQAYTAWGILEYRPTRTSKTQAEKMLGEGLPEPEAILLRARMEALEFLQDRGMEFTPGGLRRDAHKFGWLCGWIDEWQANWKPPHLCNTDGDDLLWHTASFSVDNPLDVRRAMLQQQDVEYDDQEEEFVWPKRTGRGAKVLGGPVTLGKIEFVGDELVLTVNSAKRVATARRWLEKLPGVVFLNVKTRRWDERDKDRSMDERISKPQPVEITPELAVSLQEMIDKQYIEWIDTALPILGGRTPRQVCRIPGGRQQVSILIRTMPDPMGDAPVRIPREAMLCELGLTTESLISQPLNPQMPQRSKTVKPTPPDGKVGRNDPCPCGSGRKYKKCCGR